MATLWIDVDDVFEYMKVHRQPSGIQRIIHELSRSLVDMNADVGFVRRKGQVAWREIESLFNRVPSPAGDKAPSRPMLATMRRRLKKAIYRLPADIRAPLLSAIGLQMGSIRSLAHTAQAISAGLLARKSGHQKSAYDQLAALMRPGDTLAVLGALWYRQDYPVLAARLKRERGVRIAILIHDLIPIRRPEWCDAAHLRIFGAWVRGMMSVSDIILTNSKSTAEDVERYAREEGISLCAKPIPVPIGSGFQKVNGWSRNTDELGGRLPPRDTYALMVSTIEVRKNHALLFSVWRRLLEEMPAAQVPTLVFAGRIGWLVSDLMQQLHNSKFLNGKIMLIENATDAELGDLYDGCLFTLFPSFYEGWGLPVTESLAFGRPCIVSNATSLPEAGGSLARYFDPENVSEAYAVIRGTIEDRTALLEWREHIKREFQPVAWSESAKAVLRASILA